MQSDKNIMNGIQDILGFCQTLTILYVEDDNEVRHHTKEMMEGLFDEVASAKNGKEGLKEFNRYYQKTQKFYDIVITDIQMPIMDGLEMSKALMNINEKQIIIINSAYSHADNLLQLIDLGINYFLPKPLHFKQLFKILKKISLFIYNVRLSESYAKELELVNTKLNKTVKELEKSITVAQNATKAKDDFFANISHEIRTPMNAIIGFSHLTLETNLDKKQLDYINKIKSSGDHLLGLVNDILDFSKIEAGKLEIEHIEFNINTILDNASSMIALKAQDKGLEVIYDIDNSVPAFINGDPLRLGQIIINLMNNAVKFTDSGEITLKAKMSPLPKNKKLLIFEIIDTGIGITKEQMGNLFQSFSQASSETSRKYGGTGLGLTISKQLVEMMGGKIRVVSEYGVGSRFIFSIVTEQPHLSSYRLPSRSLMSKKVLIIDSNSKTSSALAQMLRYFQYDSVITSNINSAKSLSIDHIFDIICIDKQLIDEIDYKTIEMNSKAKIVLIENTLSHNDSSNTTNGIEVDAYLKKPFNQLMIFELILDLFAKDNKENVIKNNIVSKDDLTVLRGSHILLAEDNQINQTVILGLLDDTGIKVTVVSDGKEAVSYTKKLINIDLILMDINMPIMDGYEATLQIRKNSRYDAIPIIALTGHSREEDIARTKKVGMQEYLFKPINVEKLYALLLQYIIPKAKALQSTSNFKIEKSVKERKPKELSKNILDIEKGLLRVDDNKEIYKNLLERFIKLTKKSALKIDALIKTSQRKKALIIAVAIENISKDIYAIEVFNCIKLVSDHIEKPNKELPIILNDYNKTLELTVDTINIFLKDKKVIESSKLATLDRVDGLNRIGNNGELYHEIIFKFYEIFEDSADRFKVLVGNREFEEVANFAHYIRGAAGNISALAISDITQRLENEVKNERRDLSKLLDEYTKALSELLNTIDSFREDS